MAHRNHLDVNDAAPNGPDIRTAIDAAMQAEEQ
jgi:hypothetical protein